jgi:hypothetical protein
MQDHRSAIRISSRLDRTRCGRLRIIYGEDSHSSPHIPEHFRNYPDDALEPDVRSANNCACICG